MGKYTALRSNKKKNTIRFLNSAYPESHEKNNTVVKVTPPSKNMVLLFGQPEKVVISISPPN